jgi:hypothetical protein
MAKATGHGGARPGAGRKRKPAAEKLMDGNPGKRPIKVIPCDGIPESQGVDMITPAEWLTAETRNAQRNLGGKIFKETWKWIQDRRCGHVVTINQVEQYASNVARFIQCEEAINQFGLLAKHPTTGQPVQSPYVIMRREFLRQANMIWAQIFQTVQQNSEIPITGNHNEDIMEQILTGKI